MQFADAAQPDRKSLRHARPRQPLLLMLDVGIGSSLFFKWKHWL